MHEVKDMQKIAVECGAVHFSPAPLRAVRGYSFTFEQLEAFAERLLSLKSTDQAPFGWWVESQQGAAFYTAEAFTRQSFDTGHFTPVYKQATPGQATAAQIEAAWREGWAQACESMGGKATPAGEAWEASAAHEQANTASQSQQLEKAAYLCVEESGVIDFEVIPPCTLPAGEYDLYAVPRSASSSAYVSSLPVGDIEQLSQAVRDVVAARKRQVEIKGYSAAHDDKYQNSELAAASSVYAGLAAGMSAAIQFWPWHPNALKTGDTRAMMVISAALAVAQVEWIDRQKTTNLESPKA